jgi:hypothetical protein
MRKLASIQRISSIMPIVGADKIEVVSVLGWSVVVNKTDRFKEGDLVCYCECDSIMPERPEFEFLRERKFRIKTIKLRQQVSQGICFPLSILPKGNYQEGDDVTEILGVKKYDPQAAFEQKESDRLANISKNRLDKFFMRYAWYRRLFFKPNRLPFPAFIKKTDEDRIQLFPHICETHADTLFQVSEKIDGQSATYFLIRNRVKWQRWFKPYFFGVCSRNFQLTKQDDSSYWDIAKRLKIKDRLLMLIEGEWDRIILQGEIIGPKIQGNKYNRTENEFYAFNLFLDDEQVDNSQLEFLIGEMGLKTVPMLRSVARLAPTIKENLELANGISVLHDTLREGLVYRNYEEGLSFKVVSPEFLLKNDE